MAGDVRTGLRVNAAGRVLATAGPLGLRNRGAHVVTKFVSGAMSLVFEWVANIAPASVHERTW